jgi:hypothetical protein
VKVWAWESRDRSAWPWGLQASVGSPCCPPRSHCHLWRCFRNSRPQNLNWKQLKKHRFWDLIVRYQLYVLSFCLKLRSGLTLCKPLFKGPGWEGGFSPCCSASAALAADLILCKKN